MKPTSLVHRASVRRALIKSIRQGVFFDMKYWARRSCSKFGDALKPVYFSRTIMSDVVWELDKCAYEFVHRCCRGTESSQW